MGINLRMKDEQWIICIYNERWMVPEHELVRVVFDYGQTGSPLKVSYGARNQEGDVFYSVELDGLSIFCGGDLDFFKKRLFEVLDDKNAYGRLGASK